jgi:hypothetical protein
MDETQFAPFRDRLRELGYVEGENLVIEMRFAHNDPTRHPALIAELEAAGVEVIVCGGLVSCLAVKQADSPIPTVIWTAVVDAISNGLVQNIARPEGNMTGLAGLPGDLLTGKQLEILHTAVPGAGRVGVLAPANWPVSLQIHKDAASRLGLDLYPNVVTVQEPGGIESARCTVPSPCSHRLSSWASCWRRGRCDAGEGHRRPDGARGGRGERLRRYAVSTISGFRLSKNPSTSPVSRSGIWKCSSMAAECRMKTCQSLSLICMPSCEVFMSRPL